LFDSDIVSQNSEVFIYLFINRTDHSRARSPSHFIKTMPPRLLTTAVMLFSSFGLSGQEQNETATVGRTTCLPQRDPIVEVKGSNDTAVEDSGAPAKGSWPGTAGTKVHSSSLM
jgi:hypothetical protein